MISKPEIRLTQTVQKGGCAAKVAATELRAILSKVRFPAPHPELLVDGRLFDDAAIYRVAPNLAMVQTIDFFTPIVDSPDLFGKIAACNAVSDVYAMGGRPITAMGVLAFPLTSLSPDVITAVMQGACDLLSEAKVNLVGGHSIDDDTLKFGLSVTGLINPDQVWTNQGARPGDRLILTKPIGTGTMTAALKRSARSEAEITSALQSMTRLNNIRDFLTDEQASAIHAATDITGFGLSGHAWNLSAASGRGLKIDMTAVPYFDEAPRLIEEGFLTKAHRTNREYTTEHLTLSGLNDWQQLLIHDPQTSGGLLLAVAPDQAASIVSALRDRFPGVADIGEVTKAPAGLEFFA